MIRLKDSSDLSSVLPNGPGLAFLDIDGVLADTRRRQRFLRPEIYDWDAFCADVDNDPCHAHGKRLYLELRNREFELVYLTGRSRNYHERTLRWLEGHGFSLDYELITRPVGSRVYGPAWKRSIVSMALSGASEGHCEASWWHGAHETDAVLAIDDDVEICRELSDLGIGVIQALWQPKAVHLFTSRESTPRS